MSSDRAAAGTPWYRDAVIYQLHVKSFQDGNGDGIGDFPGLLSRMDYLAGLGVDALWLLPFYPSPRRDDGYDVADYLGVSPDYGTLDDVRRLLDEAHARGLRVLGDLVLNHTSDRHPWFERARRAPRGSEEHDFYVWSDSDQRYAGTRLIFPDVEKSNWTWDPVAGRYFFHRFYSHQPDLNYDNPRVLEEMLGVLRHWLDLGFDGFRLDAVAYLAEEEGTSNENLPRTHQILKRLRAEIDAHYPDRVLLAEANQWPEDMKEYFGDDDECHMAFHFPLMPRMYMAVAQEDRFPITDILAQTPATPPNSQWAIFLRNHDELTLEMVTDAERDYLWQTYAADPRARLNLGIRRRLAPLLQRDRRRIELMTALLLTLPGTPVIYYGDEIGMGDNIHLGDRDGVRTPMQWSIDRNGGFSGADAQSLVLPTLMDPLYGYQTLNVETQERDPHSLLHWVRSMLRMRRRYPGLFGAPSIRFLASRNRRTLAYLRDDTTTSILCVANLARTWQAVELDLSEFAGRVPLETLGGAALPAIGTQPYLLTLPPYGFFALDLAAPDRLPEAHPATPVTLELPTLVLRHSLCHEADRGHFARIEALVRAWLAREEGSLGPPGTPLEPQAIHAWPSPVGDVLPVALHDGTHAAAPLLLSVAWEDEPEFAASKPHAIARVRRGARMGRLVDATHAPGLLRGWIRAWQTPSARREPDSPFVDEPGAAVPPARGHQVETLVATRQARALLVDRSVLISIARAPEDALDPVWESLRALSRRGCRQSLRVLGSLTLPDRPPHVHAFAQAWRATRGHAAQWTFDFLQRALHEFRAASPEARIEIVRGFLPSARLLGSRLARLHLALEAEFGAEAATHAQGAALHATVIANLLERLPRLAQRLQHELGVAPTSLEPMRRRLRELRRQVADAPLALMRIHGDARLEHIRLTADDAYFIGFVVPAAELRLPGGYAAPPLADLANLLHGYARASAALASIEPGDEDARQLSALFLGHARRATARRYQRVRDPGSDGRMNRDARRWLELLLWRQAVEDLECAPNHGAFDLAWQAFRLGAHLRARRRG